MKWISEYFRKQGLESQLFLAALFIAIPYFVSSIIFDLASLDDYLFLIIDVTFLAMCLAMIFLNRLEKIRGVLINVFCVFVLGGFVFYWASSGGLEGGGPYVFAVVAVLVILISRGWHSIVFSILLIGIALFITSDWLPIEGNASYSGLLFDFILNLCILSILLIFFKRALDKERDKLEKKQLAIEKVNAEMSIKSTELELYNRDVETIKKNLEKVAEEHFINLEKENQKIIEYSFINAHLVRAPLSNIIGIVDLIDNKNEKVESLEKSAKKFDAVLHKISGVLHQ